LLLSTLLHKLLRTLFTLCDTMNESCSMRPLIARRCRAATDARSVAGSGGALAEPRRDGGRRRDESVARHFCSQ
jgi:hypothetical protein